MALLGSVAPVGAVVGNDRVGDAETVDDVSEE
jgi:hypothetical protein